jgi:hypothetical protein
MKSLGRDHLMIARPRLALRFGDGGLGLDGRRWSARSVRAVEGEGRGATALRGNDLLWVASKLGFGVVRGLTDSSWWHDGAASR